MNLFKITKKYILFIGLGIFLVIGAIVGVTYSYFVNTSVQNDKNTMSTLSCLDLSFTSNSDSISLSNVYPYTLEEGMATTPYNFTIKNNCSSFVEYYLVASVVSTSTLNPSYVKVEIDGDHNVSPKVLNTFREINTPEGLSGSFSGSYVLKDFNLGLNESNNLNFRMWLDGDNEVVWNAGGIESTTFSLKLSVVGLPKSSVNTQSPWLTSTSGSLLNAIKQANEVVDPVTAPGRAATSSSEAELSSAPDDYGTSYYFRGNVQNNYVSFANMCWRIVRITGSGAIKLVLYNYDSADCSVSNETGAFARWNNSYGNSDENSYLTQFNTATNNNAYVGLMYGNSGTLTGTTDAEKYSETHENTNKSALLNTLEAWYEAKLKNYAYKLADTIWCNDKSTSTEFTAVSSPCGTGLGYGNNKTLYASEDRIYGGASVASTTAWPTLLCPNDNAGGKLSKFTANNTSYGNGKLSAKIGLLTGDEVAFAGSMYNTASPNFYLNQNATGSWWWTMSPAFYNSGVASNWGVFETGSLVICSVSNSRAFRPAISLDPSTMASGAGTQYNPYVVQ